MTTCHIEKRALGWIATVGAAVTVPLGLGAGTASAAPHNWDAVAECESGGDWTIDTGNGYYGGLQFLPETWKAHGGKGDPSEASKAEQIRVAETVLKSQGVGAWPDCGQYLTEPTEPVEIPKASEIPDPTEDPEETEAPDAAPVPDGDLTPAERSAAVKAAAQEALDSARKLAEQNGSGPVFEQRVASQE
ncbi:transglycosylase family protein [Rhodococcus tibetensis]|uniref:Transglycosylase family protein n=1 Tax=Rhodococcus tibetensis TaxID=2965064 RepID=A0ABT1Q6P7_9NOCA|nr:transglycosylase family protein [Rhodococcus sp. FXJ9.536]MCQ4117922.1 transglycosylase family protein [Rhodococcus sp. FXJ9.536]